jgi:GxxExxY protein
MSLAFATNWLFEAFRSVARFPSRSRNKGLSLDCAYRMDLVVDAQILVELKVVERLLPVHEHRLSPTSG